MPPEVSSKKDIHLPSLPYSADYQPKKDESIEYDILSYPAKSRETLAKVISERISFLQNSIAEINAQIQERQQLKAILNSDIEQKLCQTQNTIYELELDICGKIDRTRRRISLEKQIADLYKEKRQQELLHWQDTVMLKRELRNAERELRTALLDLWMLKFLS